MKQDILIILAVHLCTLIDEEQVGMPQTSHGNQHRHWSGERWTGSQKTFSRQLYLLDSRCCVYPVVLQIDRRCNRKDFLVQKPDESTACLRYRFSSCFAHTIRDNLLVSVKSWALFFLKHFSFKSLCMMSNTVDLWTSVSYVTNCLVTARLIFLA